MLHLTIWTWVIAFLLAGCVFNGGFYLGAYLMRKRIERDINITLKYYRVDGGRFFENQKRR